LQEANGVTPAVVDRGIKQLKLDRRVRRTTDLPKVTSVNGLCILKAQVLDIEVAVGAGSNPKLSAL
jgi:hypothetical protein